MSDDLVEPPNPLSVALVLRQCVVTFGGVEQTALGDRAATLLESLTTENAALKEWLRAVSIAVTNLTGGGSEWFTPVGDDHYVCPTAITERLGERLRDGRDAKMELHKAKKRLREAGEVMQAMHDDLLMRAKCDAWKNDGESVVSVGNGVWARLCAFLQEKNDA